MKHVLVAAVVAAALAVPGVAAAQGTVTITLTQDGQDLANALGISVTQLQQDTEDAIAEAYDVNRVDDFLRAFADATSFSNRGIGVDYAANADGLMLGVSGNVAVAVGDLGQDEAGADHPVAGVAPNLALMGGLNFSRWDLPQLTIYGNAFYRSGSLDKLTGSITSVGAHAQYKFFSPTRGKKALVLQWGGFDVTAGVEMSRWAFSLDSGDALETGFTLGGTSGSSDVTLAAQGTFALSTTAVVVPLEATTSLRLLYFLSVYAGGGIDVQLGKASLDADLDGTMTAIRPSDGAEVNMGTAQVQVTGEHGPSTGEGRVLAGVQANFWKLKTFVQLNFMPVRSASVAFGLRLVL
ncbi:MAG: hypothetical protein H6709_09255 [Kofleriaceae bacterium]|nr:hypothetical protein [Kofleriaceae bacterium]MCB9572258.1 hypothetical protein [Kofleriaceae bacterium]